MKIKKCWFGGRFVLFLAKIHLANGMTQNVEKIWCADEYFPGKVSEVNEAEGVLSRSLVLDYVCD